MSKGRYLLGMTASLLIVAPALAESVPPTATEILLEQAEREICDPESTMYCQPHTVFLKDQYAAVLAAVQPTAGLLLIYTQDAKTKAWKRTEKLSLAFYQEELSENSALPEAIAAYFMKQIDTWQRERKQRQKSS